MEQKSKVLISMSCGLFKEKGIKKHNVIAYESNLKYFLQKIKLKKIYFKKLNLIINTSRPRFSQEKLKYPSIKYHLKLLVKLLKKEKLTINIINNQKFGFNGCKLPNAQRKKNSRQSLQWFNLFEK